MVLRSGLRAWLSGLVTVLAIATAACSDADPRTGLATEARPVEQAAEPERGPVRDDRYPDELVDVEDVAPVVAGDVAARAETVVREGDAYVEVTIESAAPDRLDVWAIELDGQITTRTSDNPGSTLGIALAPFGLDDGEPFTVVVIAEDADGTAVANSEALIVSAPVGPVDTADPVPEAGPFDEQDSGSRG